MTDRTLRMALLVATLLCGWTVPPSAAQTRDDWDCAAEVDALEIDTLGEALEQLRREGVRILYTSRLVDASARVDEVPCSGPPEVRLRALLAPERLAARLTPDGQFVIGLAPTGALEGTIRAEPGGQAIAFANVRLMPAGETAISDQDGQFRIQGVPTGKQSVVISSPGYVSDRWQVKIEEGTRHRLDAILRLNAESSDEILVSTRADELPFGTLHSGREQARQALSIDQDVLAAASRLPGTNPGEGVAFGVRNHESERLTLVVDGIEIAEPYHFRNLGILAGAVTPNAIEDFRLHRGSPPVVFGDRAGGVLEVLTETPGRPFLARLGVGDQSAQAMFGGVALGDHLRWLAAYRRGEPEQPPTGADLDQRPSYWDGLVKLTFVLRPRHELTLQTLEVSDDLSARLGTAFIRALTIDQDSRYSQLRYLGTLGRRHLLDTRVSKSELARRRFGQEQEADILTSPETNEDFVLDDQRTTRRATGRADGTSALREDLEWRWGLEIERETTTYDYLLFAPFLQPQDRPVFLAALFSDDLDQRRVGLYSQTTWRPRDGLTLSGGLRIDDGHLGEGPVLVPRLGASFGAGSGVWQFGWARVHDSPDTHELQLADGEDRLSGTEKSDYFSLGYTTGRGARRLSIELYHQHIENPRLRFENLFQSMSRVPELELDRYRVDADASRNQGLEVRYDYRSARIRASATYALSRFEDRLVDGTWRPRRSDRRHALTLSLATELPFGIDADLLWRSASGRRSTPLDLALAGREFEAALGEINSQRLPMVHRLDLRFSRRWQRGATTVRAGAGVDNLFDRRNAVGLDLLPLRDTEAVLSELPVETGPGRALRWSLELSW